MALLYPIDCYAIIDCWIGGTLVDERQLYPLMSGMK